MLFLSQAAPHRPGHPPERREPCLPLPVPGSSGLASRPLASGAEAGIGQLPPQMPSRAGAGSAGGVTTLSQPPEGARCQCAWALPAMTGPPLSLAHLLTVSGLLCYSAGCLGELCVCVCVCVLCDALGKKRLLESQAVLGNFQQPLNLQVLCWCWNCRVKGFDVGVRAILAPTLVCPFSDPGWQAGSCPLGSEAAWCSVAQGHPGMGGREVLQPSPGRVLWLTAAPQL